MHGKTTLLMRGVLVILILIINWFVWGDQVTYVAQKSRVTSICSDFSANVVLIKNLDRGMVTYLNGVLVNKNTVITVKHGLVNTNFRVFVSGKLYTDYILKVSNDPILDLSYITIREISGPIPARVSPQFIGPFTLIASRNYKKVSIFAGEGWQQSGVLILFPNGAAKPGDSGAPLLNKDCEVVALVHGGFHSFLWNLRPTSQYIPLVKQ